LFKLFDKVIQQVGVEHIVQFIIDNSTTYKATGKKLLRSKKKSQHSGPKK